MRRAKLKVRRVVINGRSFRAAYRGRECIAYGDSAVAAALASN